jgi:hypothetical protein
MVPPNGKTYQVCRGRRAGANWANDLQECGRLGVDVGVDVKTDPEHAPNTDTGIDPRTKCGR